MPWAFAVIIAASAQATSSRGFNASSRALRQSRRDRDPAGALELGLPQPLGDAAGEPVTGGRVGGGHHDRELLAADPADDVRAANRRAQDLGEGDEDSVAGSVAVHVVDLLEIVDVEHEDGHRIVRAARARQLGANAIVEEPVVPQPGERVRLGLLLELRADLGVVERERDGVAAPPHELELLVREAGALAEPMHVQRALHLPPRDERDDDHRFRLVGGRPRNDARPAASRCASFTSTALRRLDRPAGDALAHRERRLHDLGRPAVARQLGHEPTAGLVDPVDRQRVARNEVGDGVEDDVEEIVEPLLCEEIVEDIGEPKVRRSRRSPRPARAFGARGASRCRETGAGGPSGPVGSWPSPPSCAR